jgi:hypothetical protein
MIDNLCEKCFCASVDVMRLKSKDALRDSVGIDEIMSNLSQIGTLEIKTFAVDKNRLHNEIGYYLLFIPHKKEDGEKTEFSGFMGLRPLLNIFKQMVCDKIKIKTQ